MRIPVAEHTLELYQSGSEFYPALLAELDRAQREILFESYIFNSDVTGTRVAEALMGAARRGVSVQLLVDDWGSNLLSTQLVRRLREAGVKLRFFRPVGRRFLKLRMSFLRRNHRKVCVVDESIAFVGGINICDEHVTHGSWREMLDYAVSLRGPEVGEIVQSMRQLWRPALSRLFRPVESGPVKFVQRDNLRNRHDIEKEYLQALRSARNEILMAQSYFFPGRRMRRALRRAVRRGVRVRLLLQGSSDVFIVLFATRMLYPELLKQGIEIYEYLPSYMHAKVGVVDGRWATVGSCNLDPTSLMLNLEANVVVFDAHFASHVQQRLEHVLNSPDVKRVQKDDLGKQRWWMLALNWACFRLLRWFADRFNPERRRYF